MENSGFEGKWVRGAVGATANSDILDNQFYIQMRGNWDQVAITHNGVTKKQWQRPNTQPNNPDNRDGLRRQRNMFLNSDIAIAFNITTLGGVEADGTVSCEVGGGNCNEVQCCDRSSTNQNPSNIFRTYVNNNTAWLQDFTDAFHKMTHLNNALVLPA